MNKTEIVRQLELLGAEHKKSWKKERLAALLDQAKRPDRIRDASRQKGS